jgi:hypothetical protein
LSQPGNVLLRWTSGPDFQDCIEGSKHEVT